MTLCLQYCPAEFRNDGLFCFKLVAFGRGTGYLIWNGSKYVNENISVGSETNGALW